MNANDKDFFKSQFDKIFVGVLLVLAVCFLLHVMHDTGDVSNVSQAWGIVAALMGILGVLITGKQIGRGESENTKSLNITETIPPPKVELPEEKPHE